MALLNPDTRGASTLVGQAGDVAVSVAIGAGVAVLITQRPAAALTADQCDAAAALLLEAAQALRAADTV